jgi:hypothetical protein
MTDAPKEIRSYEVVKKAKAGVPAAGGLVDYVRKDIHERINQDRKNVRNALRLILPYVRNAPPEYMAIADMATLDLEEG